MNYLTTKSEGHWQGSFLGTGKISVGKESLEISLPKEFQGRGHGATPEDLILSALGSCYLITLGIVLETSKIKYECLKLECFLETEISRTPNIKKAVLRPTLVSGAEESLLLEKIKIAENMCLISKALNPNIQKSIEPIILKPASKESSSHDSLPPP